MKNLKKNLQAVNRELKALAKKVDKIVVAVGKLEKPKVAKKPEAKVVKRKPVRKTVAKKPAKLTAVDTVLALIRKSKKGVNTATLMKKTGFKDYKIHSNVYRLKKQGKIKSVKKGVYLKA
jgi:seryl-tRNA synthetase